MDPCDVWGAAPSWQPGEDWRERCLTHWVELAKQAGLSAVIVGAGIRGADADERSAGRVDVDGLIYEVLLGPRQRTRFIDDEGEARWGLIDAVWVEPIHVGVLEGQTAVALHLDLDSSMPGGPR
jgi:hypothetical protein